MSEVKFKLAAGTNVGLIRQNNEDNFVVCPDFNTSDWLIPQNGDYAVLGDLGALLVVADGMGGANAGEVASAIAVQTIQDLFKADEIKRVIGDDKAIQKFMVDVVKAADMNIFNRSKSDKASRGMGTTIVMAWILGKRAYVCWCGDSRCYALTRHNGLIQISKDHSYVQELVDRGELEPEYMHDHPLSNVITRCLGDLDKRALPETRVFELYDGDAIMLCSDGLSGMCSDNQIEAILAEYKNSPMECKNELISAALAGGGHDNVTVALCTVQIEQSEDIVIEPIKPQMQRIRSIEADELRSTVKTGKQGKNKKRTEEPQLPAAAEQESETQEPPLSEAGDQKQAAQTIEAEVAASAEGSMKEDTTKEVDEEVKKEQTGEEYAETGQAEKADAPAETDKDMTGGKTKNKKTKKKKNKKAEDEGNEDKTNEDTEEGKDAGIGLSNMKLFLLLVLIIVLIAAYYISFDPDCEPIREALCNKFHQNLTDSINQSMTP